MADITDLPSWVTVGGGGTLLYFAYKFFWPSIRDSMSGQAVQWRSENRYIAQLEAARDRAIAERELAENRADELFKKLSAMEAQMEIMGYKLGQAQAEIAKLSAQISKLTGANNA